MAEWPKTLEDMALWSERESVRLIPADLGRELYEALDDLLALRRKDAPDRGHAALARYEREVGDG